MKAFTLALIWCLASMAALADEAPTADQVMADAKAKATAEHKVIFLHFGASWCGWCKRLEAFMDQPDVKPVFEKYFVPVKLVVQERGKNKVLENAGTDELLEQFGGPGGLPYCAFLQADGSLIVNSKRPTTAHPEGENIGYPGDPEDIVWFDQMMKKASPGMDAADLKTIDTALQVAAAKLLKKT